MLDVKPRTLNVPILNLLYLQPIHNELALWLKWNDILFQDKQCKVFWSNASQKISPRNTLSSVRLVIQESETNHTSKQ